MDPLSLTTSIFALIGAVDATVLTLRKLSSLRHLSATICALNNEVTELRILLQDVDLMLLDRGQLSQQGLQMYQSQDPGLMGLVSSLQPARHHLEALDNLIRTRLLRANGTFDRLSFLRSEKKAALLQSEIRASRMTISAALAVLTS